MEPDLINEFVPGDQTMQPMGIQELLPKEDNKLPTLKELAGNVIKNRAIDYAAGKLGLNAAQATGILGILGMSSNMFPPIAAISALTGRSLGISDYLANKRAEKEIKRQKTMSDAAAITDRIEKQITAQDIIDDRGRGQIPTKTTTTASAPSRPSHQSAGIGGLHSDY